MKRNRVFIMDLLCMVPFYDCYLYKSLKKKDGSISLGTISFYLDVDYFKRRGIRRASGLIDVVARLRIYNKKIRRGLKAAEYMLNLGILLVRFSVFKTEILHIQFLPMITVFPFEFWFLKLTKIKKIKLVYTVHNILPHDTANKYKRKFQNIYKIADILICHTEQTKNELMVIFKIPEQKIRVVPAGPMFHDLPRIESPAARLQLGYHPENAIILFFGLIRPYKGIEFLLTAWKNVANTCPDAVLILAGKGDSGYLNKINRLIQSLGIINSVKTDFRFIPIDELSVYHQAADILVYPYKNIIQSGALLTGMTFGKAIVATNVGGFKETLVNHKNAILIDYGDINGMSRVLIDLVKQPGERNRLGMEALRELKTKYSWDIIADKVLECYKNSLAAKTEH
jgi:glycosyltransferase involved in cell wall biosynthesis